MNGHSTTQTTKSYPPGIHAPSVTFFKKTEQQEIDWVTQGQHLEFLVKSGVQGSRFPEQNTLFLRRIIKLMKLQSYLQVPAANRPP